MKSAELARLQFALETKRLELEEMLRNRDVIAVDSSADLFDQIQRASERDMAIGNLERESKRLREVQTALGRIHQGTYGICLDCEEEISIKRLTAVPWTESCIACQEAADDNRTLEKNAATKPFLTTA